MKFIRGELLLLEEVKKYRRGLMEIEATENY
jgi:hypothetical protein